jgi:YVTN family beta-propeller protein
MRFPLCVSAKSAFYTLTAAIAGMFLLGAAASASTTIYTADEEQGTVTILDLDKGPLATVPVGVSPHNVDVTPDGRLLLVVGVAAHSGMQMQGMGAMGALVLVDIAGDKPVIRAEIAVAQHPAHVVPSPDSTRAFVTDAVANAVVVVDLQTRAVVGRVSVGSSPHGLRLSPDGKTLAVANMKDGTVSIIDTASLTERSRFAVGRKPVQVGFTPDGRQLLVSLNGEDRLAILDVASGRVTQKVRVGRGPIQVFATADQKSALVANQGTKQRPDNRVCLVPLDRPGTVQHIVTGAGAHGVTLSPDGKLAFFTNTVANTMSVIDVASATVLRSWPTGKAPNGVVAR